ncbi:hypothetical protein [Spirosoma aerolatum]|uniref:hypothetical protein n=1 Tax=Spirosoma aerolatum TaxID=1211326 RepID=UPI001FE993C2|nr:hypothetical protein [Spirosoma aerolatum]
MTTTCKQFLVAALFGTALFTSCSRPTAYFQRSPVETVQARTSQTTNPAATPSIPLLTESVALETVANNLPVTYARTDSKLIASKKLGKRIERMKYLLATAHGMQEPAAVATPHKLNLVERIILKKVNKKISHRLAPAHPEKVMLSKGPILIGGAVLLIGGLLMLIMGSGTVAFIGLIASLIGALGVILGLFEY